MRGMTDPYAIWGICLLHLNPLGKSPASTVAKPIWNLPIASAGIRGVAVLREKRLCWYAHIQWTRVPIFGGLFQNSGNMNSDGQLVFMTLRGNSFFSSQPLRFEFSQEVQIMEPSQASHCASQTDWNVLNKGHYARALTMCSTSFLK